MCCRKSIVIYIDNRAKFESCQDLISRLGSFHFTQLTAVSFVLLDGDDSDIVALLHIKMDDGRSCSSQDQLPLSHLTVSQSSILFSIRPSTRPVSFSQAR